MLRHGILTGIVLIAWLLGSSGCRAPVPAVTPPPHAAPADTESTVRGWIDSAAQLADRGQYDAANFQLEKAVKWYARRNDYERLIECHQLIGKNYQKVEQWEKARAHFDIALDLLLEHTHQGKWKAAQYLKQTALEFRRRGNYDEALRLYFQALDLYRQTYGEQHREVSQLYNLIAMTYLLKGDVFNHKQYYQKSLQIKMKAITDPESEINRTIEFIGNERVVTPTLSQEKETMKRSVALFLETFGSSHRELAPLYESIAAVHILEGAYDEAMEMHRKAMALRQNPDGGEEAENAVNYAGIGICLRLKGDAEQALRFLDQALTIKKNNPSLSTPSWGELYFQIGLAQQDLDRLDAALESFAQAIRRLWPGEPPPSLAGDPPPGGPLPAIELAEIAAARGETLHRRYLLHPLAGKPLESALEAFEFSFRMLDRARRGTLSEAMKLRLAARSQTIHHQAVETAWDLYEIGGDHRYLEKAFQFSEKSKAVILSDALNEAQAIRFGAIPEDMLQQERELKNTLAECETNLERAARREGADEARLAALKERCYSTETRYQQLLRRLEEQYHDYYQLKYDSGSLSSADIARHLRKNEVLLEYFLGQRSIFLFVVTAQGLKGVRLAFPGDLPKLVEEYTGSIKKIEDRRFIQVSRQLHDMLVAPARALSPPDGDWIIIPHGILATMPFEALLASPPRGPGFPEMDFLLRHHAIRYHFSARLWLHIRTRRTPAATPGRAFIGFAPLSEESAAPSDPAVAIDGVNFPPLPGSAAEVQQIAGLFRRSGYTTRALFGPEAVKEQLQAPEMNRYGFIHIATHTLVNPDNPKLTGLLFHGTPSAPESGVLYSGAMYNLAFNAELLVLSSCESGIGRLVEGEGMMALTRGFFYSGARRLVLSLWKVEDRATGRLMVGIYRHILEGDSYAAALQHAKLELLREPLTAFPKYWSSFILFD